MNGDEYKELRTLFDEKIKEIETAYQNKRKLYNRIIWGLAVSCITIVLTGAFTIGANWKNTSMNKESLELLRIKVEAIDNMYVPATLYFHVNRSIDLEFQVMLAHLDLSLIHI